MARFGARITSDPYIFHGFRKISKASINNTLTVWRIVYTHSGDGCGCFETPQLLLAYDRPHVHVFYLKQIQSWVPSTRTQLKFVI